VQQKFTLSMNFHPIFSHFLHKISHIFAQRKNLSLLDLPFLILPEKVSFPSSFLAVLDIPRVCSNTPILLFFKTVISSFSPLSWPFLELLAAFSSIGQTTIHKRCHNPKPKKPDYSTGICCFEIRGGSKIDDYEV